MRFLALQTNVEELKRRFVVEGEQEILTTAHHPFAFIVATIKKTGAFLFFLAVCIAGLFILESAVTRGFMIALIAIGALFYAHGVLRSYIEWRYNFLVVTTQKLVVIQHKSFWRQNVNPIHLNNLASTRFESQLFGIMRCGVIHISLKERESGSTREIILPYIPHPDVITGAIEAARAAMRKT